MNVNIYLFIYLFIYCVITNRSPDPITGEVIPISYKRKEKSDADEIDSKQNLNKSTLETPFKYTTCA